MKVLVYGSTGSQGGAVVHALLERGHEPFLLTRHPDKAAGFVAHGAKVVIGDLLDADSLKAASTGMDAVAFMLPFSLPNPLHALQGAHNAIEAARSAGVKLIVYNTSGTVLNQRVDNPMFDLRSDVIDGLKASGVPYITIEPTAYLENLLGPWTAPNVAERDLLTYPAAAQAPIGWMATADVGALVVAALERPELAPARFMVSGVENLTGPALAARVSEGLGRTITYSELALDDFAAILDNLFGPGAGAGAKTSYEWQREKADLIPMWTDMAPVLEKLPVTMTSVADWAEQFAVPLSPQAQAQR
ncbi:MAG: NmrA family NAD(P)-binding protein [Pleurocapsa minor GSE-CHR-MK-17-07R]|jgi:uncharacterized protein YbjT (DUF2867 family)|nr:NmrA family NAD(P)-binding protein [Pleurocapsa minor GSE-CHR-MK 17-07R]